MAMMLSRAFDAQVMRPTFSAKPHTLRLSKTAQQCTTVT